MRFADTTGVQVGCLSRRNVPGRLWLFESARCAWAMMGIGVNNEDNFALTPWTVKGKGSYLGYLILPRRG
jgi:hypothetical protein